MTNDVRAFFIGDFNFVILVSQARAINIRISVKIEGSCRKNYVNFNFVLRMSEAKLSKVNGKISIMKKEQKDVVSKMYRLGCLTKDQI